MAYDQLKLDNQLCFRLYTAARLITACYTPFFKDFGITYPQYLVLMTLWEKDDRLIGDITETLKLETNTITPLIQRMEKQGLVVRRKGQTDSRQKIVSLTEKGWQLQEQVKDIPECLVNNLANNGLSIEELSGLAPLLDKLIDAIQ